MNEKAILKEAYSEELSWIKEREKDGTAIKGQFDHWLKERIRVFYIGYNALIKHGLRKEEEMNDQINTEMALEAIPADLLQVDAEGNPIPVTVQTTEDRGDQDQPLN